jgi:hypothetical protein
VSSAVSSKLSTLVEVLRLLAMEPDEQASTLPNFVDVPDELALLFGDQCDTLAEGELQSSLGDTATSLVREIEEVFRTMAGKGEYYSMDALRDRAEWSHIRELSRRALDSSGLPATPPNLSWVTYVRGG